MGSLRTKINQIALSAYHYPLAQMGLSVSNPRPLTKKQTLKYFLIGAGYSLRDVLQGPGSSGCGFSSSLAAVSSGNGASPTVMNFGADLMEMKADDIPTPGKTREESRKPISKDGLYSGFLALSGEKIFFTQEEVARFIEEDVGRTFRVPLNWVGRLLEELVADGNLSKIDEFYYLKKIKEQDETDKLARARDRVKLTFAKFKETVDDRIKQLDECGDFESLWNVLREDRGPLGFRGVYLFLKANGLVQKFYTSDREPLYRDQKEPAGIMKTVLNNDAPLHRIVMDINQEGKSVEGAFQKNGFTELFAEDNLWFEALKRHSIGSVDLIKLSDENGNPVGVLLLRDSIYFGDQKQAEVDGKLLLLAQAIGRAVGRIRNESEPTSSDAEAPLIVQSNSERQEMPYKLDETNGRSIQYLASSGIYRSGRIITECVSDPAKKLGRMFGLVLPECNELVKRVTGSPMPVAEVEDHVRYVKYDFFDREGSKLTGLASIDEHSEYTSLTGKLEKLIYYSGILIDPDYRGGRVAHLTFLAMMKTFMGFSFFQLLRKTPLVFCTQSGPIFKLTEPYIGTKHFYDEFAEEDKRAVNFLAEKYGWQFDGDSNIIRNKYSRLMADKAEDLLRASKNSEEKIGELDTKVCIGYVNWLTIWRLYSAYKFRGKTGYNGPGSD